MVGAFVRWFLYSTWFSVALVAFIYLSIPEKKLKRFVQHHAAVSLKSDVKIQELKVRGITGLTLSGVRVELPLPSAADGNESGTATATVRPADESKPDGEGRATQMPGYIMADNIMLDVNTLGILTGKPVRAAVNAEVSGGSISNFALQAAPDGWIIDLGKLDEIDLGPMRVTRTFLRSDLDLNGRLSGEGKLHWKKTVADSNGRLKLQLTDTLLPYVGLKDPRSGFLIGEMFQVALGDLELSIQLDKAEELSGLRRRGRSNYTTLLIDKFLGRGEHVEVQLDGGQQHTITFSGPTAGDAEVNIKFVVHFTDDFFDWKGDGVRADGGEAKGVSHSALRTALQMQLRRAQTKVGKKTYYGFHCRGKLKSFKCPPSAPSRRIEPVAVAPSAAEPKSEATALKRPKAPKASKRKNRKASNVAKSKRTLSKKSRASRRTRPAGKLREPSRPESEVKKRIARARGKTRRGMRGDMLAPSAEEDDESLDDSEEDDDESDEEERGTEGDDDEESDDDGVPEDGEPLDEDESDDESDESDEDDEYDEEE